MSCAGHRRRRSGGGALGWDAGNVFRAVSRALRGLNIYFCEDGLLGLRKRERSLEENAAGEYDSPRFTDGCTYVHTSLYSRRASPIRRIVVPRAASTRRASRDRRGSLRRDGRRSARNAHGTRYTVRDVRQLQARTAQFEMPSTPVLNTRKRTPRARGHSPVFAVPPHPSSPLRPHSPQTMLLLARAVRRFPTAESRRDHVSPSREQDGVGKRPSGTVQLVDARGAARRPVRRFSHRNFAPRPYIAVPRAGRWSPWCCRGAFEDGFQKAFEDGTMAGIDTGKTKVGRSGHGVDSAASRRDDASPSGERGAGSGAPTARRSIVVVTSESSSSRSRSRSSRHDVSPSGELPIVASAVLCPPHASPVTISVLFVFLTPTLSASLSRTLYVFVVAPASPAPSSPSHADTTRQNDVPRAASPLPLVRTSSMHHLTARHPSTRTP